MSACIILLSVPNYQARIDFLSCQVPDEFMGFQEVPYGIHYVNIKSKNNYLGFWCFLKSDQILVKFFSRIDGEFEDPEPEYIDHYQELTSSGFIAEELILYDYKKARSWLLLTCHIKPEYFPVTLHTLNQRLSPIVPSYTDWQKEVFETHQGKYYSFIAEFQFAFIRWYVSDLDRPGPDAEAFNRWRYLVEATCNADMSSLAKASELVDTIVIDLISQFESLEDSLLPSDDPLVTISRHWAERMISGSHRKLAQSGQELKNYLEQRYHSA
jgi:hypothetical protein